MLILPDANRFWVDFDEFGERVLEPSTDRNGAANGEIEVWKFIASDIRGRINTRSRLRYHDDEWALIFVDL